MRVEIEEVSYERLGSCVSWTCFRDWGLLKLHILFFKRLLLGGSFVDNGVTMKRRSSL